MVRSVQRWRHVVYHHVGRVRNNFVTWTWSATATLATCIPTSRCTTSSRSSPNRNVVVWIILCWKFIRPFWSINLLTSVLTNQWVTGRLFSCPEPRLRPDQDRLTVFQIVSRSPWTVSASLTISKGKFYLYKLVVLFRSRTRDRRPIFKCRKLTNFIKI
jgi:hypothetical protein